MFFFFVFYIHSTVYFSGEQKPRWITIAANRVVKDEGFFQVDLFTDTTKLEKEKKLQNAMLGLKKKFGKNAVLKGTNYLDGATMRERNQQIGGHKAK